MKAKVLISIIIVCFFSINIYSQDVGATKISKDKNGYATKECIKHNKSLVGGHLRLNIYTMPTGIG